MVTMLPRPVTDHACRADAAPALSLDEAALEVAEVPADAVVDELSELELVSTRADRALSSVKEALTEEAFVHTEGASAEPLTNVAAMHCSRKN